MKASWQAVASQYRGCRDPFGAVKLSLSLSRCLKTVLAVISYPEMIQAEVGKFRASSRHVKMGFWLKAGWQAVAKNIAAVAVFYGSKPAIEPL